MICNECTARTDPTCDHLPLVDDSCPGFFNAPCSNCGVTPCECDAKEPPNSVSTNGELS